MTDYQKSDLGDCVRVEADDGDVEWSFITTRDADEIDTDIVNRYRPDE